MRVLIADDQEMLREVLEAMLTRDRILVTLAHDLESALFEVEKAAPFDLILLDYHMPGMDGLDGLRRALVDGKGARIALMSGNLPSHIVRDALLIGAAGFLPKKLSSERYVQAIRAMVAGQQVNLLDDAFADLSERPSTGPGNRLTSREILVLQQLERGLSLDEIAAELGLKGVTVNFVVKTLCRKFEAGNSAEAVAAAKKTGLI